jgi:hypothetical protein
VFCAITVSSPHSKSGPVYIIHSASNTSEQGCLSGQSVGVGHGGGVVRYEFLHPQVKLLHLHDEHVVAI